MIDLVLAGDNAIVIGLAAAGLPTEQRTKAVLVGHHCCNGASRSICRSHDPVAAGGGPCARRWHSPSLGELEDVS